MNPYDSKKWGVHVQGPDSILAAHSFEQAVEKANQINQQIISFSRHVIDHRKNMDSYPISFAQVARWEQIAGGAPHTPDETNWDEVF